MAVVLAAGALLAACAPGPPVEVESARAIDGPIVPDREATFPDARRSDTSDPDSSDPETPTAPVGTLDWGGCEDFGIPDRDALGTDGWECATLEVEMNPFGSSADLPTVRLALTRHRATGSPADRRGALLLNPGGPGAAGVEAAWGVRSAMPSELLRAFDVVGWDPRGVGRSVPAIDCGAQPDPGRPDFMEICAELTGPLAAHVATPYSAGDMERIREALGEETLHYLGYSYGTLLGAAYAGAYPDRVGGFVLDGAPDPDVGSADGPFSDGFPTFADDGYPAAEERFVELCDATDRCLPGLDAAESIDEIENTVDGLPTDRFDGAPDVVDRFDFVDLFDVALGYAGDWELFATALGDAAGVDGVSDASALAALISGDPELDPDADADEFDNFDAANFVMYCADLADLIEEWGFCDGLPVNERRLEPVAEVELRRPILVIGGEYDPLTPGYHAAEVADALGDAVHVIWEGVGHTAFPGWTDCIDGAVADQLMGRALPVDGSRCPFVGVVGDPADDAELADELFGYDYAEAQAWIADSLDRRAEDGDPDCLATAVADEVSAGAEIDATTVSHVILDVTSPPAVDALGAARSRC